jgi:hypothetical protein
MRNHEFLDADASLSCEAFRVSNVRFDRLAFWCQVAEGDDGAAQGTQNLFCCVAHDFRFLFLLLPAWFKAAATDCFWL